MRKFIQPHVCFGFKAFVLVSYIMDSYYDFVSFQKIESVLIQAGSSLQRFTLSADRHGNFLGTEHMLNGDFQVDVGNTDQVQHTLSSPINLRFLRLYVHQWKDSPALRWDLIGCPGRYKQFSALKCYAPM